MASLLLAAILYLIVCTAYAAPFYMGKKKKVSVHIDVRCVSKFSDS